MKSAFVSILFFCALPLALFAAKPTPTPTPTPVAEPAAKTGGGGFLGGVGGAIGDVGGSVTGTITSAPGAAFGVASGGIMDVASGGLSESIDELIRVHEEYPANIQTHILQDDATTTVVLSIQKVVDSMDELPDKIAAAVVKVLQETGEQQPELRETLKVVDENMASVDTIINSVTGLVEQSNATTVNATPLMRELTALLEELNQSSRLANQKLELMKGLPAVPPSEPVDLKEVDAIVKSTTQTLAEVRQTVEQLRIMTEKGTLKEGSMIVSDEIQGTIDSTLAGVNGIITRIIVGLVLVIVVFFGMLGAIAYFRLWIAARFAARAKG